MNKSLRVGREFERDSQNIQDYDEKRINTSGKKKGFDVSSKKFFTDIKAELKNIRTDVNKLVQKDKEGNDDEENLSKQKKLHKTEEKKIKSIKIREREKEAVESENKGRNEFQHNSSKWQEQKLGYFQKINNLQFQLKESHKLQQFYQQKQMYWQSQMAQLKSSINHYQAEIKNSNDYLNEEKQKNRRLQNELRNSELKPQSKRETDNFKEIGISFENRINEALNENQILKNRIALLQSEKEEQEFRIRSMSSELKLFQEKENLVSDRVLQEQLISLRKKVMCLEQKNDKLESDHEYEIMKLENEIDEIRNGNKKGNESSSLNEIIKDQLAEIQYLRAKLREKK